MFIRVPDTSGISLWTSYCQMWIWSWIWVWALGQKAKHLRRWQQLKYLTKETNILLKQAYKSLIFFRNWPKPLFLSMMNIREFCFYFTPGTSGYWLLLNVYLYIFTIFVYFLLLTVNQYIFIDNLTVYCSLFLLTVYCLLFSVYCLMFTANCVLFNVYLEVWTVNCYMLTLT